MTALELIAALPAETRDRLRSIEEDGTLRKGELDVGSLVALRALSLPQQDQVLSYLETQKIYLANSRSRSGFVFAACERAKHGSLDPRGLGYRDPWRPFLLAAATPKRGLLDLVPEQVWLEMFGKTPVRFSVDTSADRSLGGVRLTLTLSLDLTVSAVKARLVAVGVGIPSHKLQLQVAPVGFLRDERTLAYYNLDASKTLVLKCRTRGGKAWRDGWGDAAKLTALPVMRNPGT